ncbi:ankyrin repeat and IBR domain-containing protein 1 [Halyomorpha halys]|uniref:ankyrin repeat and IBR domain-containing protein 1 n=1 Tax=Halyomorpha halys TaxID=286706 RepID=UPI0006D4F37C
MGSASSKFRKYIQNGDEFAAMQIHQSSPELRKNLDPNLSYGESHHHNTALHYAAKHGMKHLLRMFLTDLSGNPNKKNGHNESVLHCACTLGAHRTYSSQERRASCVQLLLQWRGPLLNNGEREKVDINAQDYNGNTAMHVAAWNGLFRCAQLLVSAGANLFLENNERLTPCDVAMKFEHHNIARMLEAKMVFTEEDTDVNEADIESSEEEAYSGLRSQDLQEAKDQLLVETSDMLNIPLFTAEALLRDNEWSRELLLEKWMKDPRTCCQRAGVPFPGTSYEEKADENIEEDALCGICLSPLKTVLSLDCGHKFCRSCWSTYLTSRIQEGDSSLVCPASACRHLVCPEVVEGMVSPTVAKRYLQFDIKAFVEQNKTIKWCPHAGCGRAVKLPQLLPQGKMSHAVDCGSGHFFCWECLGEAHAPSSCHDWRNWLQKISQVRPEEITGHGSESEDAANCLWLVTNSKPCPNCKSPIQKNEGCNHMRCSKCKCDFCWVCLESWKRHSSATGGYFRCNRFEAVHRADEKQGVLITEAVLRNQQTSELNRFLHYYTRFKNHDNSRKMEEPLLQSAKHKMELLASGNKNRDTAAVRFIEEGARELLKARRILCGSYVYGYYLQDNGYNKTIFEFMQNELEEVTEKLSEMLARPYLRSPRSTIVQTTSLTKRKRQEFIRAVSQGWVPPDTTTDCSENECCTEGVRKPGYAKLDKSTSYQNVTGDDNMELVIALEMSRLQMIEDQVKKRLREESLSSQDSSIVNGDAELALAIQLSLTAGESRRNQRDFTVDSFLRSLAGIDLRQQHTHLAIPKLLARPGEEGRFEIGEVHTSGVYCPPDNDICRPRRSRSTGDLARPQEPRYHLDSDHSSHDERPEEAVKRLLAGGQPQSSLDSASDSNNPDLEVSGIMENRPRLSSIGKTPALDIPDSELTRDKSSFSLSSESEDVRPPIYISGVSISRTPEPAPEGASPGKSEESELSSILHVQERNLSSDDFHEAFFLWEGRRRRRSRREPSSAL